MVTENKVIQDVKDAILGIATGGASVSGWPAGQAALIGAKVQEASTARIAQGQEVSNALDASVPEAEMVLIMDVFCRALDETHDAMAAFERVVAIKRKATEGVPGATQAEKVAKSEYLDAIKGGLAPQSALLSAFLSAGAVMRIANAGKH